MKGLPHFVLSLFLLSFSMLCIQCETKEENQNSLLSALSDQPSIKGKPAYLNTPYVTAGNRVYTVGHQNGSFPDLGWHVSGEMGGVWNHPIKLLDGYMLSVEQNQKTYCLNNASTFTNYPLASQFSFKVDETITVEMVQFVPDDVEGTIVEYNITNHSKQSQTLKLSFNVFIDLSPVWLAEKLELEDGTDNVSFENATNTMIGKDENNEWWVAIRAREPSAFSEKVPCNYQRKGKGKEASLLGEVVISATQTRTIQYYIAGSYMSREKALINLQALSKPRDLLTKKSARYQQISRRSEIDIPDKEIQQLYNWTKYNTDWLVREVPEIGSGLSAGIPDYPWWFGADNCYALQGLLATGAHEEVTSTLAIIDKLSEKVNDNGRIMHEASTNGVVFNPGNLNETPHYIFLLWQVYLWTGDKLIIEDHFSTVEKGLDWLLQDQDKDGNLYPDGPGMMEIHGLHSEMIDVVVYTQQALDAASKMAFTLGKKEQGESYANKAQILKEKINGEWWVSESKSFADFISSKEEAMELIEAAIVRADTINKPWAVNELNAQLQKLKNAPKGKRGFVVHHNWVVNTPLEMGIADDDQAQKALVTARNYTNRFGSYVTGIDQDESTSETSKWKSFSYVGAVMTLPTGVQAIAEARYGNIDHSLDYLKKLYNSFSYAFPGSMYEVSPDYGMIAQAWNIYAVAVPIVNYYFGIKPNAPDKTVEIAPALPSNWPYANISNVRMGANNLSLDIKKESEKTIYEINQTENWQIVLSFEAASGVTVNGEKLLWEKNQKPILQLNGLKNIVEVYY
ncbi:MAG: glycogen debranching protein [Cyclobacteriaceae bacterium]